MPTYEYRCITCGKVFERQGSMSEHGKSPPICPQCQGKQVEPLVSAAQSEPWVVEGRVVAVADGDTITILDRDKRQHKIRFNGIDAPEKRQPYGNRSRKYLSRLVFDRNVRTECHKRDRYGRDVCRVVDGSRDVLGRPGPSATAGMAKNGSTSRPHERSV